MCSHMRTIWLDLHQVRQHNDNMYQTQQHGHVYLVCLSNSVCGTTTGTFSWHQPYIDYILTIFWPNMIKYWANMIKYQQNITKTIKYMSIFSRNVIFSKPKNPTSKINQGFVFLLGEGWKTCGAQPLLSCFLEPRNIYPFPSFWVIWWGGDEFFKRP